MNVLIIQTSPNDDGLTAACAAAAAAGARLAGADVEEVCLNELQIGMCRACNEGWGECLQQSECSLQDDFGDLHARVVQCNGLILVSPVYWGEMSESAKAFTDRLRRCEATRRDGSRLADKPVIMVAAAGGSGGGMITCLASMERWVQHVRAKVFDLIPVNRWSRAYKLICIREAAKSMVSEAVQG